MPPQVIKREQERKPFIPFRLHVSDGSYYDVMYPTDILVDLLDIAVGAEMDAESGIWKKSIRIAPNHITRIEPLSDRAPLIKES